MELLILTSTKRVVIVTIVVLFEVSFQPLAELKVVKGTRFDELSHIDVSLDAILIESSLKHLVVLNELVLALGVPLDTREGEGSGVEGVEDGAVDGAGRTLLNFGQVELQTNKGDHEWHTEVTLHNYYGALSGLEQTDKSQVLTERCVLNQLRISCLPTK